MEANHMIQVSAAMCAADRWAEKIEALGKRFDVRETKDGFLARPWALGEGRVWAFGETRSAALIAAVRRFPGH